MRSINRIVKFAGLGALLLSATGCGEPAGEVEVEDLVQACRQCHSGEGDATIPGWPPLTSLSEAEIESKLRGYRDRAVPGSVMADVAHDFTEEEISALARYYSKIDP